MPVGPTYLYRPPDEKDDTMEEDISDEYLNQQAKRDRVKRLSAETNRRRKALEIKKRLEAQKELERRTEVLEERRKKQQDATQRYQRSNRTTPKKPPSRQDSYRSYGVSYTGPRLHEGVPMARGHRVMATTPDTQPAVDDVLRMVGHHSDHPSGGYQQKPLMTASPRDHHHDYGISERSGHYQGPAPGVGRNTNTVTRETDPAYHQKYHGYTTTATLTHEQQYPGQDYQQPVEPDVHRPAASSIQQSNGLDIHRELAEQQRVFIDQQRKSLMEFNRALLEESSRKNIDLDCSSVSSLDSLEDARKPPAGRLDSGSSGVGDYLQGNAPVQSTIIVEDTGQSSVPQEHMANTFSNIPQSRQPKESFVWKGSQHPEQDSPVDAAIDVRSVPPQQQYFRGVDDDRQHYEVYRQPESGNQPTSRQPHLTSHSTYNKQNITTQQSGYSTTQSGTGTGSGQQPGVTPQRGQHHMWDQNGRRTDNVLKLKVDSPQVGMHRNSPKSQEGGKQRMFPAKTAATPVYTVTPNQEPTTVAYSDSPHSIEGQAAVSTRNTKPEDERVPPAYESVQHQRNFRDTGTSDGLIGGVPGSPKSILRKFSKYSGNDGQKWGHRDLRDSVEIASTTHMRRTASGKSVRWTDMAYADSDQGYASEKDMKVGFQGSPKGPLVESKPPMINARLVQQKLTASAEMEQQKGRAPKTSKTTFRDRFSGPNEKTSDLQSRETETYQGRGYSTLSGKPPTGKLNDPIKLTPKRVNGMTLNKTPTDEEINQLWDKVRTCLHSREGTPDQGTLGLSPGMRRVSSDQSLSQSGQRLTANLRVAPPNKPQGPDQSKTKKYHTVPRWRTNSDSGTVVSKRASLLQRTPDRTGKRLVSADGRTRVGPPAPVSSQTGPNRSAMRTQQMTNEVDDSLLAFQRAELLAHQNYSESEIEAALNQRNHQQNSKMPSALSLEEQRILESLDRLNEKLRITSDISTNYAAMTPRPPAHGPGPSSRGHRPASFKQYGTNSPGRPGLRVRSTSADRESARIWTYR